jgi:hypothetical protein
MTAKGEALQLRAKREWLTRLLANYEVGRLRSYDEDLRGAHGRSVTAEHAASIRETIAEIDRQLSELDGGF